MEIAEVRTKRRLRPVAVNNQVSLKLLVNVPYQIATPSPTVTSLSLHFPGLPNLNFVHPSSLPAFVQAATAAKAASQRIAKRMSVTAKA